MKPLLFALGLLAISTPVFAQQSPADMAAVAAERSAAMAKLTPLHGEWRGTAKGNMRGHVVDLTQSERVGPMLSGDVVVIEGRGYKADGTLDFNAFAIVSYDTAKDAYEFRAYANGYANIYPFWVTETGYVWEMPAGPGAKIRYDITIKDNTWIEVGAYIRDGAEPVKFIELNLDRLGDSDWPAAGYVTK